MSIALGVYYFGLQKEDRECLYAYCFASIVFLIGFSTLMYFVGISHIKYDEIWNSRIDSVEYWERWTTLETESREVAVGTDSKGNTIYETEYYDITEEHGPYWYKIDEYCDKHSTNAANYNKWLSIWNNEKVIKTNKGSAASGDIAITGNVYACTWTSKINQIYPYESIHTYVNKVRATKNTFNFSEPSEEDIQLFPRPADTGNMSSIISYGCPVNPADELYLRQVNAHIGSQCQIHIMLLLFDSEKYSRSVTDRVLSVWQGTNKNELAIFMGLKNNSISWIHVNSWLDNTTLHSLLETELLGQNLNVEQLGEKLLSYVPKYWIRKEFKDFDYLKVNIRYTYKVLYVFVSFIICGSMAFGVNYTMRIRKSKTYRRRIVMGSSLVRRRKNGFRY